MHRLTKDITGQTFGKLTVREVAGNKRRGALWLCDCSCGNTKVVSGGNLRCGMTKSCGCLRADVDVWASGKRQRLDLAGRVFEKLTVIRRDGHIDRWVAWICRCECGTEKRYRSNALHPICRLKSCGKCWNTEKKAATAKRHSDEKALRVPKKKGRTPLFPIDADIAALTVSKQRKLQLQWNRMGLCRTCGKPQMDERGACEKHQRSKKRTYEFTCAKCGATDLGKTAAARHCARKQVRPIYRTRRVSVWESVQSLLPAYSV